MKETPPLDVAYKSVTVLIKHGYGETNGRDQAGFMQDSWIMDHVHILRTI